MKRKLIDIYGCTLALIILGTFSGLILAASGGSALPALWYFWTTGSINRDEPS